MSRMVRSLVFAATVLSCVMAAAPQASAQSSDDTQLALLAGFTVVQSGLGGTGLVQIPAKTQVMGADLSYVAGAGFFRAEGANVIAFGGGAMATHKGLIGKNAGFLKVVAGGVKWGSTNFFVEPTVGLLMPVTPGMDFMIEGGVSIIAWGGFSGVSYDPSIMIGVRMGFGKK